MKTIEKSNELYCNGGKLSPDWNGIIDETVHPVPEPTQDEIEEEEWHEIHDDINESKRNGEIE